MSRSRCQWVGQTDLSGHPQVRTECQAPRNSLLKNSGRGRRPVAIARRVLAMALALASFAVLSGPARAGADQPTIRFQLQWFHQAQFAGFYVAAEQGYYEREGINVELIPGGIRPDGTTIDPLQALADGTADLANVGLAAALLARRAGNDAVNIAQVFRKPATTLLCRRDGGIRSLRDLRGQKIGVWNIGDQYNVAYWLRLNNLTAKDVTLVEQRPDGLDLLESKVGCVTAMTYNEYWTILNAGVLPSNLVITRSEGFLEDGIYASAAAIADPIKADRMARFLRASADGWRYAAKNFDEALALTLAKSPGANPQHQRRHISAAAAPQGIARPAAFSRALTVFDTVGVAAFTVVGAEVALMAGVAWFWVPICAALTCAGGGMLLDIVTGREPRTFQGEPYEEIAIGGGLFILAGLLIAGHFEHEAWIIPTTLIAAMVGVFTVRLMVVRYGWRSYRLAGDRPAAIVFPAGSRPFHQSAGGADAERAEAQRAGGLTSASTRLRFCCTAHKMLHGRKTPAHPGH